MSPVLDDTVSGCFFAQEQGLEQYTGGVIAYGFDLK